MKTILSALLLITSVTHAADTYVFAKQGTLKLGLDHEYITDRQFSSSINVVGFGLVLSEPVRAEFGFHDFGVYSAVLSKPIHIWRNFYIDLPGMATIKAYGPSAGLKYQTPIGLTLKASAVHMTAQAQIDTPIGYRLYEESKWLPMAEIGWTVSKVELGYMWLPGLSGWSVGVNARF